MGSHYCPKCDTKDLKYDEVFFDGSEVVKCYLCQDVTHECFQCGDSFEDEKDGEYVSWADNDGMHVDFQCNACIKEYCRPKDDVDYSDPYHEWVDSEIDRIKEERAYGRYW